MRKLMLCVLIGLLLQGCGENKEINKDYLVGGWNCVSEINSDGEFEKNLFTILFKIDKGMLLVGSEGKPFSEFDLDKFNNKIEVIEFNDFKTTVSKNIEYITNEKFKMTTNSEVNKVNSPNQITKMQTICTRIK